MDGPVHHAKRRRTRSATGLGQQPYEVGIMRREGDQRDATFIGSGSGIHFVKSVHSSMGRTSRGARHPARQDDEDLVPGEEDALPNDSSQKDTDRLWDPSEISNDLGMSAIGFEDLVSYCATFFDYWHPALPFLHAPTVLEWYETIAKRPITDAEGVLSCNQMTIVRSIMSISLADRRQEIYNEARSPVPASLVFHSLQHALASAEPLLIAAPSMEALQAALSVQLFVVSMLRHNAASRLGGLMVRAVFQLGLHRCPVRFATFSRAECEMRQRLFWSIYYLDRYICQSLGTPITLRDDDIDVCPLNLERHSTQAVRLPTYDSRFVLLKLISNHAQIKGLILELHNKSIDHRRESLMSVARIKPKVEKWFNQVEHEIDMLSEESAPMSYIHEAILHVLHNESIIALNRPMLAGSKEDDDYGAALQSCISASRSTIKTLAGLIQLNGFDARNAVPLIWPSFTWATWMSAFVVIYAASEREMPLAVAISLATKGFDILKHLGRRGSTWPEACAAAVQDLITRLRNGVSTATPESQTGAPLSNVNFTRSESAYNQPSSDPRSVHETVRSTNPVSEDRSDDRGLASLEDVGSLPNTFLDFTASDFSLSMLQAGGDAPPAIPDSDDINLFRGFEIPFWLGDDHYFDINAQPQM